jgi:GntP family gluconate:H+ symporter
LLLTHANYLLLCTVGTIALLMVLILRVRLHPALAILVSAVLLGVVSGMPLGHIPNSLATGVGNLMAHVALVLAIGAMLGNLLASSGGATAVGEGLVDRFGPRGLPWAMLLMGMLVGLPVFFEVGLVLLMPIVVSVARRSGRSQIVTGLPTLAGLSIVHGTVPPHPAAMLAVTQYHADVGKTILLGVLVGLPAAAVAGPVWQWVYVRFFERWVTASSKPSQAAESGHPEAAHLHIGDASEPPPEELLHRPGLVPASLAALLLPVVLIFLGSGADWLIPASGSWAGWNAALHLVGDPPVALLIALLVAQMLLSRICGWTRADLLRLTGESFAPIAGVLLILAAAGGLSRILNDSGAAQATIDLAMRVHLSPLLLAWLLAATVRLAIGSATVAMAVTTGILAPLALGTATGMGGVSPELLVLATGSGSLFCSHVNDPGFWMIKEFFGMELKETLATWSVLETVLSIAGLAGTLLLASVLH